MNKYFATFFLVCAALMCGCSPAGHSHEMEEEHEHEEGVIHLTDEQADAAELATEIVKAGDFEECVRVSGQVTTAQGDEAAVTAKSSGVLTFMRDHLTEGVAVSKGESIARISAAGMQGGDGVAQQHAVLSAAKAAYERAKVLMADTLISRKEFERVKQEYDVARLAAGSGSSGSVATSPLSGFIRSVMVKEGEFVEAGSVIATVTKSCNLQLRAEVPEKYFQHIKNVRSAYFEMSYGGGIHQIDSLHGHIVSAGQAASETSAYIPLTFEFENDGCMVPGSFADIWLLTDKRSGVISVPSEAVTEEQGVYYVYLKKNNDDDNDNHNDDEHHHGMLEFEKREVQIGASNGLRTEIVKGLKSGDEVVVKGVTQVKLAGASGNIPEAHSHNH